MDKYLKQLLETYAKVILPSFGAIVVENEETGNLMFNEYLSYNDGKLDDLIVSESNMELQEAQNMIAKYVRDIQVQIDKGESYDIFGLGRFYKNEDGDVEFEGNLKNGPKKSKKDSPKTVATEKQDSDKKKEEAPKSNVDKKESKPELKKDEVKKETKVDSKEKSEVKKGTKSESKSTEKENKFVANKDKTKQEVKKEPKPVKKEKAPKPPKKKKEKKPKDGNKKKRFGAFFWVAIIILALASAGLIYVGLNYEQVKSYMGWDQFEDKEDVADKKDSEDDKKSESIELDADDESDTTETSNVEFDEEGNKIEKEQGNSDEKDEPTPAPEPAPTASNGTHHLIAGSFSNKSNAESLVKELKDKGLNARILGEFGGLHFVSAASYNSSKEARADIDRVRQNAPGSWIFKYNNK